VWRGLLEESLEVGTGCRPKKKWAGERSAPAEQVFCVTSEFYGFPLRHGLPLSFGTVEPLVASKLHCCAILRNPGSDSAIVQFMP